VWDRIKSGFPPYLLRREHWILTVAAALILPSVSFARYQFRQDAEVTIATRPYRPGLTFHSSADLVEIEAVVRRSNGEAVDKLTAQDFAVRDNGKLQTISQFSVIRQQAVAGAVQVTLPRPGTPAFVSTPPSSATYIGFFLDDANTSIADLVHAREGVRSFVGSKLPADEQVAIATESSYGSIEFTRSADDVDAALKAVSAHPLVAGGCPPLSGFEAERIVNQSDYELLTAKANEAVQMECGCRDARSCTGKVQNEAQMVYRLAAEQSRRTLDAFAKLLADLAQRPGKRVIVFASDGFFLDFDLRPAMDKLINEALRDGIVVDSLDAKGVATEAAFDVASPNKGLSGREGGAVATKEEILEQFDQAQGLSDLAWSTGGDFFHGSNDLRSGVRELMAPPKVAYLLGFVPTVLKPDGSTHTLKISVAGHYRIQARHGYMAPDKISADDAALTETLRREAASREPQSGIVFTLGIGRYPQGTARLSLTLDPRRLPLLRADGRNRDRVEIVTEVFDRAGTFLTGSDTTVDINLRDETLRRFMRPQDGIVVSVPVADPPGTYQLRVVAVEAQTGRVGADFRPLVLTP